MMPPLGPKKVKTSAVMGHKIPGNFAEFLMLKDTTMHQTLKLHVQFKNQHIRTKVSIKAEKLCKFALMKFNEAADREG